VRRSILVQTIFELWGSGKTLEELHDSVRRTFPSLIDKYITSSFKFWIDSYNGNRTNDKRLDLIKSFAYLPFEGDVKMRDPDEEFTIFEDWPLYSVPLGIPDPNYYYMGRRVAVGIRERFKKLDLKKRRYISTTSMDSELSLISANMVLAGPGKLIYDPFAGTGSFPIACAEFGSLVFGSDIDGRNMRGQGGDKTIRANFDQYGLLGEMGGFFAADLTNTPIRRSKLGDSGGGSRGRIFDGILCDPPYGVREGLHVLGVRDPVKCPWVVEAGIRMYK
jgi:tRNA (guanine10-N2)-methyltransferase